MSELVAASLENIDQGNLVKMVNDALVRMYRDCNDRPNLQKPRTVTLCIELTPKVREDNGQLFVEVQGGVNSNLPRLKGPKTQAMLRDGSMFVNASPHLVDLNKDQMNILEIPGMSTKKAQG